MGRYHIQATKNRYIHHCKLISYWVVFMFQLGKIKTKCWYIQKECPSVKNHQLHLEVLAQWLESWTGDLKVEGSIPVRSTRKTLRFSESQRLC